MSEKSTEERIKDAASLSDKEAKFAFLKSIDPTISDHRAAKLCTYKGDCGSKVKKRIAGKLGDFLAEHGIGVETIAEKLYECLNAKKTKHVFLNQYKDGKQTGTKVELKEIGPDYTAILKAVNTLTMFQKIGEGEEPPVPQIPETTPTMSQKDLQNAVGRGGPVVVDADYDITEEPDAATG